MDIDKYLQDKNFIKWINAPDEEAEQYWKRLKKENPDNYTEFERAKAILKALQFREYSADARDREKDWRKIQKRVQGKSLGRGIFATYYYKAAMLAALFILSFLLFYNLKPFENEDSHTAYIQKDADFGQKLTMQLSDGTLVKLNSGSSLVYPSEFSDTLREVKLIGEAYFQVSKASERPFRVVAQNLYTTVFGTSFNINSYDSGKVVVSLVEGIVQVNPISGESISTKILSPGEKAVWESNLLRVEKSDATNDLAWKDNRLVFNHDNIHEIKKKLERWYGVNFLIKDPADFPREFVGEFRNESLENVLETMSFSLRFEFEINKDEVIIKPIKK